MGTPDQAADQTSVTVPAGAPQDWTESGASEVAPGIYRIPLPLPSDALKAVNVYAIADGERVVLVDSGWALDESEEQLARALDKIGYGLEHVSDFLVTHVHRDHYTQAIAVRRKYGARVGLGAGEKANLDLMAPDVPDRTMRQLDQLEIAGAPDLARTLRERIADEDYDGAAWEPPDHWINGGDEFALDGRTLRSIHTPGHTRGHVVFLDAAAGVLFAGDHVLPHITPSIGFELVPSALPLADYLTSLRLLQTMPDVRLLPAHGPVTDSVHDRVDELLEHHAVRLDASLAAVQAGADTAFAVAGQLGWTRRNRRLAELDVFNAMLAIMETSAHLDVLAERGRLLRVAADGVAHYLVNT
jgi:glyoxylase-like metal-dependent hydrolase (beta-lactamase superfamily II)